MWSTGGHHLQWCPAEGMPVYTPSTPGRGRSHGNTISMLRRGGLVLEDERSGGRKKGKRRL